MVYAVFTSDTISLDRFRCAVHISQMQLLFIGSLHFYLSDFFVLCVRLTAEWVEVLGMSATWLFVVLVPFVCVCVLMPGVGLLVPIATLQNVLSLLFPSIASICLCGWVCLQWAALHLLLFVESLSLSCFSISNCCRWTFITVTNYINL